MSLAEVERYYNSWYSEHGTLNLDEIYEDVKQPSNPLHHRYTWEVGKAAREYVKQEIARDIRMVEVRWVDADDRQRSARRFLNNRDIGRQQSGYTAAEDAFGDPAVIGYMRESMRLEMKSMERRFGHLEEYYELLQSQVDTRRQTAKKTPPRKRPRRGK
jgi:hypothetical protein